MVNGCEAVALGRDAMTSHPLSRGWGSTACCPRCKGANRPAACAKVQTWDASFGWQVAEMGRDAMTSHPSGLGRGATAWRPWADRRHKVGQLARLTMIALRTDATQSRPYPLHSLSTGQLVNESTRAVSLGVGLSAIGYRLRVPATSHPPSCPCFAACQRASMSPRGSAAHASQQFTMPAVPHFANR